MGCGKQKTHDCAAIVGFLEICVFCLEENLHVASGPDPGLAQRRAVQAALVNKIHGHSHTNAAHKKSDPAAGVNKIVRARYDDREAPRSSLSLKGAVALEDSRTRT